VSPALRNGFVMNHPTCQSCRRPATESLLSYRRGSSVVRNDTFLQCDICERYACAECLQVYDIFSGYDFLCHECAEAFQPPPAGTRGH
jgi:hypothetical protein